MKNYQLIIFDLDGTLVKDQTTEPLPGVVERLRGIDCQVAVATNQGRARFVMKQSESEILARIHRAIMAAIGRDVLCDFSLAYPNGDGSYPPYNMLGYQTKYGNLLRKPNPGMLLNIMHWRDVWQKDTLFVGDMETDKQAAENAGCDFMWAKDFFGWE